MVGYYTQKSDSDMNIKECQLGQSKLDSPLDSRNFSSRIKVIKNNNKKLFTIYKHITNNFIQYATHTKDML